MTRYSSAVVISALGLAVTYGGCKAEEDGETITGTSSGGTAPIGGTTTAGIIGGNGGTGMDGSSTGTGGSAMDSDLLKACPDLKDKLQCGDAGVASEKKEVNMLLVLDKSGSMLQESGGKEKWSAMKDALQAALTEVQNEINFGLALYPYPESPDGTIDANDCGKAGNCCEMPSGNDPQVPIEAGQGDVQVSMVLDTLDATEPGGGTPTAVALEKAYNYFTSGGGKDLTGDKYVLLATDGGPNCNPGLTCGADLCTVNLDGDDCTGAAPMGNCCDKDYAGDGAGCVDDSNVVDQINALQDANIDTFVVGIPGSEAYESFLNDFAVAGGRESGDADYSYYRVEDVGDLTAVMRKITIALVSTCDIQVSNENTQNTAPLVAINCNLVDRLEGGGGSGNGAETENWDWDPDTNTVLVKGDWCDTIETEGVERVDVIFNCMGVK